MQGHEPLVDRAPAPDLVRVVCFCGGNGANTIAAELARHRHVRLTCVVNGYDDGKSTGVIRKVFGILGPSDFRKNHLSLLPPGGPDTEALCSLWRYRFPAGWRQGEAQSVLATIATGRRADSPIFEFIDTLSPPCVDGLCLFVEKFLASAAAIERRLGIGLDYDDFAFANCIYAGAVAAHHGDLFAALEALEKLLKIEASVVPISRENRWLAALADCGKVLGSEFETDLYPIVRLREIYVLKQPLSDDARSTMERLPVQEKADFLAAQSAPPDLDVACEHLLSTADVILFGPGTRSTSLFPTLRACRVGQTIRCNQRALKVLVTNIGTEGGVGYASAPDCLRGVVASLVRSDDREHEAAAYLDSVLVNLASPDDFRADLVRPDLDLLKQAVEEVVARRFSSSEEHARHSGQLVADEILRRSAKVASR